MNVCIYGPNALLRSLGYMLYIRIETYQLDSGLWMAFLVIYLLRAVLSTNPGAYTRVLAEKSTEAKHSVSHFLAPKNSFFR